MNARTLSQFMLANITLVIDRQGQIRELTAGAQPAPGEVVMTVSDDANPQVQAQLIQANDQQTPLNIDDEVAQILAQLEQGVDPTLNPDQATAAGGANGSSPTDTGTIDMTLAEVLAQTAFDTHGLQADGLSQTQSLAIDLVIAQALAPIAPVVNAAVLDVDEEPYFVDVPSDDPQDSSTDDDEDGKVDSYTFGYDENSTVDDLIGTVQAIDPENGTVTYRIDPDSEDAAYFSINENGQIYLTEEGVKAFTNDFEAGDDNQHNIIVIASDGVNEVSIPVTLNELDVNEAPQFVDPEVDDDPNDVVVDENDDGVAESYSFSYNEKSSLNDVIGVVKAVDPEGTNVTYSIDPNSEEAAYFTINDDGEIYLTPAGIEAYTNDFEAGDDNQHNIIVIASDGVNEVSIPVTLNELDVNEAPQFVDPEVDDDPNDVVVDENDDGVAESYSFSYNEKSSLNDVIGVVKAVDPEGTNVTYSIDPNSEEAAYFTINDDGEIYLTPAGIEAYTNDFEAGDDNQHNIIVIASDGVNEVSIPVTLNELDVNEAPQFVDPEVDDDPNDVVVDENDDGVAESYSFSYNEKSSLNDVIGVVKAVDPEGTNVTYSIDPNSEEAAYFTINDDGEIYLTPAGIEAYTNDFEVGDDNQHNIIVIASDGVNEVSIPVTLNELDVNEAPYFVDTSYTDETDESDNPNNYLPGNDFTEATEQSNAAYKFYYDENTEAGVTIGQVQANDVDNDGSSLSYAITSNVMVTVDDVEYELFQINAETGEISLTAKGAELYTNDYEKAVNDHSIQVSATEVFPPSEEGGDVTYGYTVYTTVDLFERNVNEAPVGENFTLDVTSSNGVDFGDVKLVKVVFDNNSVPSADHISDVDVDYLSTNPTLDDPYQDLIQSQDLSIYITELPSIGSLYYWNEDQSTYVLIQESDLYVEGNASPTKFDPNSIYYKAGEPNEFTINADTTYTKYENGDAFYTLSNGAIIIVSATSEQANGSKGEVSFETNNGSANNNQGEGFGVDTGNGINNGETLIFDLSANPLSSVSFGVDGLNSNHQATVVYTYLDGTKSEPMYYGDGSSSQSADVSYSAPADNPIVQIEFSESTHTGGSESNSSSGSNYVVSYLSGEEAVLNDPIFEYTVVDSEGAMPLDENGEVITYQVSLDVENAYESNVVYANTGNDELVGDDGTNIFTWLDSALDNSTDTVKNFALGSDKIDVRDILEEDGNDANNLQQLVDNIDVSVVDNDVTLVVSHDAGEQSIVIENLDLTAYEVGGSFDAAAFLNDVLKTTDTTS